MLLLLAATQACSGANHQLADAGPCPTLKTSAATAVIHRTVQPRKPHPAFALPAVQHINQPDKVRRLATALCALPGLEHGADLPTCLPAVEYTVTFDKPDRHPTTVTIPAIRTSSTPPPARSPSRPALSTSSEAYGEPGP